MANAIRAFAFWHSPYGIWRGRNVYGPVIGPTYRSYGTQERW